MRAPAPGALARSPASASHETAREPTSSLHPAAFRFAISCATPRAISVAFFAI